MRRFAILLCFAILSLAPLRAARQTNGTSDLMQFNSNVPIFQSWSAANQAQGSMAFTLNLIAQPSGSNMATIISWPKAHYQSGSATPGGCGGVFFTCVDIVQFATTSGGLAGFSNDFQIDITNPGTGEATALYPQLALGLHHYALTLNRTATSIKFWIDGVLQTASATGQTSDPGAIASKGPITFMAGIGASANVNFTNGRLSDVAIWQNYTLTTNDALSLAKCLPPNRISPENVVYWPLYGADSPEPSYDPFIIAGGSAISNPALTLTGTTQFASQTGCQPGGAYR